MQLEVERTHQELLETSRLAGMTEIATNVLHNVGNILNSVNVSATLVARQHQESRAANLAKVAALLQEHEHDLGAFITSDPKGRQVPAYLANLSEHLLADQRPRCRSWIPCARTSSTSTRLSPCSRITPRSPASRKSSTSRTWWKTACA